MPPGAGSTLRVDDRVRVYLVDEDREIVKLFSSTEESKRLELAWEAWRIGLRALRAAFAQADEARLADVGKELLTNLDTQLKNYVQQQTLIVNQILASYFDPRDGKITQRLDEFVRDDGSLASLLKRNLNPENSVLAHTLAQKVGESSPIFKLLSPSETEGFIQTLEEQIKLVLDDGRVSLAQALNPHVTDSPMAIFIAELQEKLRESEKNRAEQLKTLTQELDANDENSLLSQLVRKTDASQRELKDAINPERHDSPMGIIKNTLTKLLETHIEDQKVLWEENRKRQETFEKDIRQTLARLEKGREEAERSTHGGFVFEDQVTLFVAGTVQGGPYTTEATGNTVGNLPGSKKGDQVIRFREESLFHGAGLVVEAKRDQSYNVTRALSELQEARSNRDCQAGVFVMAAESAPVGFPRFARYGNDILVTWDSDDDRTNAYLHAAVLTGLALASRIRRPTSEADIKAIGNLEGRLRNELKRLDKMERFTNNIKRDASNIEDEIRIAREKVEKLLTDAKKAIEALGLETESEDEARDNPLSFTDGSLRRAEYARTPPPFHDATAHLRDTTTSKSAARPAENEQDLPP